MIKNISQFNARFEKPQFASEFGGNWSAGPEDLLEADIHNAIWAGYHLPLAATSLCWWHNLIEENDLYFYYKALACYNKDEDLAAEKLSQKDLRLSGSPNLRSLCMANDSKALVWVYSQDRLARPPKNEDAGISKDGSFSAAGFLPGEYSVEFWDTYKGEVFEKRTGKSDGTLNIRLPDRNRDFAVKIKKTSP